jgi:transposase
MSGDVHVRFCVGLGGKFPGPTRLSGNPKGAKASADLYSLIETAKANKLGPYRYLRYLLEKLPFSQSQEEYEALLPMRLKPEDLALGDAVSGV